MTSYTGGKAGRAVGQPINVGYINTENGALTTTRYTDATEEAVRAVNDYLGGVNGRPIELKKCNPADPVQAQACAQGFAADPAVVAVLQAAVDTDMAGFHTTLTPKLPVIGSLPLSPSDATAGNSFYLSAGQFGALGMVTYAREYARAKKIALLAPSGFASIDQVVATLELALKGVGISSTLTRFPFEATDFAPYLQAGRVQEADLVVPAISSPQHCVALNRAMQQAAITTPVVAFAGCLGNEVRDALGDYPLWSFLGFNVNAQAPASDDLTAWQVRAFNEWFAPLSARGVTHDTAVQMFQTVLTAVRVMNAAGDPLTPAGISAQAKKFSGPVLLGVPRVGFGAIPGLPALGSMASRVYIYLGNGTWQDTTGGNWIDPPSLQAPRR